MTSVGGDLEVDGTVTARQATQAGQAVVLGEDMKIPTSFYEGGGGVQKVTYQDGQEFIDALKSTDGIYLYSGGWGELDIKLAIFGGATFGRTGKFPATGFAMNMESSTYYSAYMVTTMGDFAVSFNGRKSDSISASGLTDSGIMYAFLF